MQQNEQIELRRRILEAIELLPPSFRAVVRLRYATPLSFREIGKALSIPEATAKWKCLWQQSGSISVPAGTKGQD